MRRIGRLIVFILVALTAPARASDALPSWNDGPTKQAILDFVAKTTKAGGPDYVKPEERVAVFDNDGTLWAEWPVYTQLLFSIDQVKAQADKHPEWRKQKSLKAAINGDAKTLSACGTPCALDIIMATTKGQTPEAVQERASQWIASTRHPKFAAPYERLVYQPMLELLSYLRANGFKTYIVSGGGVEFMRGFAERVYGVPPEQVIGSSVATKFDREQGKPVLKLDGKIGFVDDKAGKPVGINHHIGRRPIAAFGNSDGDLEMLQWTTAGAGPRFGLIVRHDDAEREAAYDRASPVGRLDKALDEAPKQGWVVVSMKKDWKTVFPSPAP